MNAAIIVFAAVAVISVVMLFVMWNQPAPTSRETTVVVNRSWPRSYLIGPGGTEWPRHVYGGGGHYGGYYGGGHYGGGHYGGHGSHGGHGGGEHHPVLH